MQKLLSKFRKCIETYNLIEENDKIAVGLSGGKDSLILLTLLAKFKRFSPKKFDLIAITIDLFDGKSDFSEIIKYCNELNVELKIVKSQIYDIVFTERKEKNPCSLCAKLRRGILNTKAKEFGCNKVALGHTRDDLVETFFLSMFFEGRLSTFAPKTYLSNSDITVIRPIIFIEERETINDSKNLPIFKNLCPANHHTQREKIKQLLAQIKQEIPISSDRIFRAIISPESYNLYDKFTTKKDKN
ncbi:MAG: tRNA 2-thiocytidine(32) synthetase TtcA [Clostridiales bacterium]|nr:tRNA 2-thiocytidine(32) synthetase TtcA [Clostridiales bacterium]